MRWLTLLMLPSVFVWLLLECLAMWIAGLFRWAGVYPNVAGARVFSWGVLTSLGVKVSVEGKENLYSHQPCVYVMNHQSGFDMATYGKIFPRNTVVIGKKEILLIPFFGIAFWVGGNVFLNRQKRTSAISSLEAVVEEIKRKKVSVWIFPEGTRNRALQGLLPFRMGAFHMAAKAGIPIVPLVCSSLKGVIDWKHARVGNTHLKIKVLAPRRLVAKDGEALRQESEKIREEMLAALRTI